MLINRSASLPSIQRSRHICGLKQGINANNSMLSTQPVDCSIQIQFLRAKLRASRDRNRTSFRQNLQYLKNLVGDDSTQICVTFKSDARTTYPWREKSQRGSLRSPFAIQNMHSLSKNYINRKNLPQKLCFSVQYDKVD